MHQLKKVLNMLREVLAVAIFIHSFSLSLQFQAWPSWPFIHRAKGFILSLSLLFEKTVARINGILAWRNSIVSFHVFFPTYFHVDVILLCRETREKRKEKKGKNKNRLRPKKTKEICSLVTRQLLEVDIQKWQSLVQTRTTTTTTNRCVPWPDAFAAGKKKKSLPISKRHRPLCFPPCQYIQGRFRKNWGGAWKICLISLPPKVIKVDPEWKWLLIWLFISHKLFSSILLFLPSSSSSSTKPAPKWDAAIIFCSNILIR